MVDEAAFRVLVQQKHSEVTAHRGRGARPPLPPHLPQPPERLRAVAPLIVCPLLNLGWQGRDRVFIGGTEFSVFPIK